MTVYIDATLARKKLAEATERAKRRDYTVSVPVGTKIEQIIGHTHLTYKYILLTGLLAKATNPRANPLVLQAGSSLDGGFDARSLCHSTVVPFEQNVLEKRLGGSNEPFLNKPARYPHLSMQNPVRSGKDRETLKTLIELFNLVNATPDNGDSLVAAIWYILKLESRVIKLDEGRVLAGASKRATLNLIDDLLTKSCEGESLALSVAFIFELLAKSQASELIVKSHPTNQSGASSNEISDVDVFDSDGVTLRYCCEAKDKTYTRADVDHAAGKVLSAGHYTMIFVYGPNANTRENLPNIVADYERRGFDITFVPASAFAAGIVCVAPSLSWTEIAILLNKHLAMMRAKETTIAHCKAALAKI